MIHVYTGEGKGKTTSAFGLALRHCAYPENKVLVVQFFKAWKTGEIESAKKLGLRVERFGKGFYMGSDFEMHREEALKAISFLKENMNDYSLVILDEVNVAISQGLIKFDEIAPLIEDVDNEVVCTGRGAPKELIDLADYVTRFEAVKHPF